MRSNVVVKKYWCTMGVRFLIFSTFDQCIVVLPISNAEFVPQFVDMNNESFHSRSTKLSLKFYMGKVMISEHEQVSHLRQAIEQTFLYYYQKSMTHSFNQLSLY